MTDRAAGDPFFEDFFARIPAKAAASFSAEQLAAVKLAFGARTRGSHAVDLRLSLPLFRRRYYLVVLAGRERRSRARRHRDRRAHPLGTLGNIFATLLFGLIALAPMFAAVYAIKSNLGLDLVPGGGLHEFLRQLWAQMRELFG